MPGIPFQVVFVVGRPDTICFSASRSWECHVLKDVEEGTSGWTLGLLPLFETPSMRVIGLIAYLARKVGFTDGSQASGVRAHYFFHPNAYQKPYVNSLRQYGWQASVPEVGQRFTLHSGSVWCHCQVQTVAFTEAGEIGELTLSVYPESRALLLRAYFAGLWSGAFRNLIVPDLLPAS